MVLKIKSKVENGDVHYVVYKDGEFFCSESTYSDAKKTVRELEEESICMAS